MKQKPISQPWLRFGKRAFLFLALSASLNAWAQSDTIRIVNLKRLHFEKNGFQLSPSTIGNDMAELPAAAAMARQAKASRSISSVFGAIGGFAFGYSIGSYVFGREMNWPVFGVGLAFIGLSIPAEFQSRQQFEASIHMYNAHIRSRENKRRPITIGMGPGGISLVKSF